ncbi:MAG TPA: response regulator transcription factor [Candidatus Acidoferrum sp.]|nr:response regulator transcription factor [Candidatus Acidoferrum sp.]
MRVLVAEDKPRMAHFLERALRSEGYSVQLAFDGEQALSMGLSGGLDVMVLDVMLPGRDGFDVIRTLREAKQMLPTIMVSARDAKSDIVRGLDLGADDYLTKPFALDVLLARVRALTRRGPAAYSADLRFQDLVLNSRTHELTRADRTTALTRTEYALLEMLIRRAGCIVPRDALVEAGWGGGAEIGDGTLYVFIRSLRGKIAPAGETQYLHTVRGVGYTLRPDAS